MNIRDKLDKIKINKKDGYRTVRCFCGETHNHSIVSHLRSRHPEVWSNWVVVFGELRKKGLSYSQIIKEFRTRDMRFLFTSKVVEKEVQRLFENGSLGYEIHRKEKIEEWQPVDFAVVRETIWNFKKRGNWAVHQGDYRGNWSPYVPRMLIELYTKKGDIVLDPFVGGGTTLIETWLTSRIGVGVDISPLAVAMATSRIQEMRQKSLDDPRIQLREDYIPQVIEGDSRELKKLLEGTQVDDNSVKLVCTHPPYLNSLSYTATVQNDLSHISNPTKFCDQLQLIAKQVFDLVTDDGICAILIGDVRKNKRIIPLGFLTMERFLNEGFKLRDIIVKTQHRDTSTRFWYTKKDKLDFLIAHEYLFIFDK